MKVPGIIVRSGRVNREIHCEYVTLRKLARKSLDQCDALGMFQLVWQGDQILAREGGIGARFGKLHGVPQPSSVAKLAHSGRGKPRWQHNLLVHDISAI